MNIDLRDYFTTQRVLTKMANPKRRLLESKLYFNRNGSRKGYAIAINREKIEDIAGQRGRVLSDCELDAMLIELFNRKDEVKAFIETQIKEVINDL